MVIIQYEPIKNDDDGYTTFGVWDATEKREGADMGGQRDRDGRVAAARFGLAATTTATQPTVACACDYRV